MIGKSSSFHIGINLLLKPLALMILTVVDLLMPCLCQGSKTRNAPLVNHLQANHSGHVGFPQSTFT